MLNRSLEIDLANPVEDYKKVLHFRYFNSGFALKALGRMRESRERIDQASQCVRKEFGENSRYLTM